MLWHRASAVVLTSATLTSCGSFQLFLQQTGLSRLSATQRLQVSSPFDYPNRAKLVIPLMKTNPKDSPSHTEEVIERLPMLAKTVGTLVLFASGRQMREVHSRLPETIKRIVLMQGTLPKMEIITRHRATVDSGKHSIIFGLASFAEGVDLPGEYCTHVIIAKLPFAQPNNPLEEARREWVEAQGKSAFIEITVPETGVRLAQAVGRLLRTDQDYGTVTILDRRLATSHWGVMLLRGLPPFSTEIAGRSRTHKRP
jgi:ATP-dependent DNA helicase DinG